MVSTGHKRVDSGVLRLIASGGWSLGIFTRAMTLLFGLGAKT